MRRDFWTWFFNGNCPPAVAATADYISSTVNQMCALVTRAKLRACQFTKEGAYQAWRW